MNIMLLDMAFYAENAGITEKGILSFRPFGQKIRQLIWQDIENYPPDTLINLNFSKIRFSDSSCVDEIVLQIQLLLREKSNNKILCVSDVNDSVLEELLAAIALREKKDSTRIPILHALGSGSFTYIGEIEEVLGDTFRMLQKTKTLTTRDILQAYNTIAVNTASNRLKKLWDYGLVFREERIDSQGKQHVYILP